MNSKGLCNQALADLAHLHLGRLQQFAGFLQLQADEKSYRHVAGFDPEAV